MSLRIIYIYFIFLISLFGSLFTAIKISGYSISAFVTFSAVIIPFFLMKTNLIKSAVLIVFPFILYCLYDLLGFYWGPITKDVIQDFSVWFGMLMLFLICSIPTSNIAEKITNIMNISKYPFLLYLTYFFINKIDAQATMMLSVLYFSFFLSKLIVKKIKPIELAILIYLIIVPIVTGSRIIYITEIIILFIFIIFYYGEKNSINDKLKKLMFIVFSLIVLFGIVNLFQDRINQAMNEGDNATVGGVQINTSGRAFMWEKVFESAKKNIIFGSGQDGPQVMLINPSWTHPHNDYLRLLHHNGIIGLILWLSFFLGLLLFLKKRIKSNNENKTFYLFNFIYLISIFIIMATDNPIVYSYIMYPFIIISASSLNLYHKEQNVPISRS